MSFDHPHFMFVEGKQPDDSFAQKLIDQMGQTPLEQADVVVSVGGDGLLLQALARTTGAPVYGVVPEGSNSRGFWADHGVRDAQTLCEQMERTQPLSLVPLVARVGFDGGGETLCHAFNDIAIERASGQSVLIELSAVFSGVAQGPFRIMGDGFVFATALGSTAGNRSYGGPAVDIRNEVVVLTGKGIYEPRGLTPVVVRGRDSLFNIAFGSVRGKRPVRIDYDGHSLACDDQGRPVNSLSVCLDPSRKAVLLCTFEPCLRALAMLSG